MRTQTLGRCAIVITSLALTGCGQGDSSQHEPDRPHVRGSSLEERQLADQLHTPYLTLLYASDNLKWCRRDNEKEAITAFAPQAEAEALARSKGMAESLELTRKIFAIRNMEELRNVCGPNFELAVKDLRRAAKHFRHVVEQLPSRKLS